MANGNGKNNSIRLILIGVVVIIVLAVIFLRGDQLADLAETVRHGAALPLIAAVCTQLCKYFSQSFAYSYAFEAVGEKMDPRATLPLVFGTFFLNTIAPSLNLAGTGLVVDDARRRGINPGKATSAALLMQITIDGGFCTLTIVSFVVMIFAVGLNPAWLLFSLIVALIVGCMIGIMVLGSKRPDKVHAFLEKVSDLVNRIRAKFKKGPAKPWAERIAYSFGEAGGLIAQNRKAALKAYGCSVFASICELAAFVLVGIAFGVTNPYPLVCGYVVATFFAMISPVPQGVGVVETAVTIAFTMFNQTAAEGMAIVMVYRSIVFWMPFLIGAVLINLTKTFKGEPAALPEETPPEWPAQGDPTSEQIERHQRQATAQRLAQQDTSARESGATRSDRTVHRRR